jgi:CheY-like chemotaxis protein
MRAVWKSQHSSPNVRSVYRLLVVDDDPAIRELIAAILGTDEYEISFARNGKEALVMARELQPEIIILDVMMPLMDGIEVCEHLKADIETAGIPVLMLTARTEFDDRVRAEDAKADAYLTKPFGPFNLLKAVEHLVALAEQKHR